MIDGQKRRKFIYSRGIDKWRKRKKWEEERGGRGRKRPENGHAKKWKQGRVTHTLPGAYRNKPNRGNDASSDCFGHVFQHGTAEPAYSYIVCKRFLVIVK